MQQIPFIDLFKSALHVSGDKTRPSSGALFDCIYSFWYNAPILLPTSDKVEMERRMGEFCRPKHVELI